MTMCSLPSGTAEDMIVCASLNQTGLCSVGINHMVQPACLLDLVVKNGPLRASEEQTAQP